jgi:signal recognition particle receptor subunit beta
MKKLHEEYIKFSFLLIVVAGLTYYLMNLISRSWGTELMKGIGNAIKLIDPSGTSIFITFTIGFYLGSLVLLFLDRKKRVQAIILSAGIVVLIIYLIKNFIIGWNLVYIVLGALIGLYLGSKDAGWKNINIKGEFRGAASNVSKFSIMYSVASLIVIYSSPGVDNSGFIADALVVLAFSFFFSILMDYELKGPKIVILGPEESGKTLFLAGCYKRVVDITEIPTDRSNDLIDLMTELHKGWPTRTKDIKEYRFTYEVGKLFPRETVFTTSDYPGIYLKDIAQYIGNKEKIEKIEDVAKRSRVKVARQVAGADILIFIIDAERFPRFEEMGIDHYLKIVTELRESGKNMEHYIVVTKGDLFKEEFPNYEKDYNGFKKFIETKFIDNIFVRELLIGESGKNFYPVFYYTKKTENPKYDPLMPITKGNKQYISSPIHDNYGNVYVYGFDKFMNQLMEND